MSHEPRPPTAVSQLGRLEREYGGELQRYLTAGQTVIHTTANNHEQRRPRDKRAMCDTKAHVMSGYVEGGPMVA
jgi:hypothetical protein